MTASTATAERRKAIENIYPLAPMQEGLLFHSVLSPDAGLYMPQIVIDLTGDVDAHALRSAWQQALKRHSVLRSGFHWEERDEPFQVVYREAQSSWTTLDWSDTNGPEQSERLAELLAANRQDAFDLRHPPLMRLHWIDAGNKCYKLVLCYHHLILDGWSAGKLIAEVFQLYLREIGAALTTLPPPRPFADYIAWHRRQNKPAALNFWANHLAGCEPTTFLPASNGLSGFARREWVCPSSVASAVKQFSRQLGVTPNTVLQGALGLLIACETGSPDVIFGSTSAGRPATLDGATEMVGLFINTLPVRIRIDPTQSLGNWLIALQSSQAETEQHGHLSLREIQGQHGPLFDCLMIVESYPVSTDLGATASFKLTGVEFDEQTHYPLTLLVAQEADRLKLTALYACDVLDESAIDKYLTELGSTLERMARGAQDALRQLLSPNVLVESPDEPRTTGASNRKPASEANAKPQQTNHIPPSTETEKILAAAWAEVLKRSEPSLSDHFFELGGHSLLAARVISRVRREIGIEIPVRSLFDRPILSDLAIYIDALRANSGPAAPDHREIEI